MNQAQRQSFFALKLLMFTEVVFWAAFGLQNLRSRLIETDPAADRLWSPARLEALVADWRRIVESQGARGPDVARVGLRILPIESMYAASQQAAVMVNFLIYLALEDGGGVPEDPAHGAEFAALLARLGRQDFSARAAVEAWYGAPSGCFVQVGANDGSSPDDLAFVPIYASAAWVKVLVEPVPSACAALRERTRDLPGVTIIDAALSDRSGTRTLTVFPSSRQSTFDARLGAMQRAGGHGEPVEVRVVDGAGLMAEAGIDAVDVLVSDTEGHDRVVLEQLLWHTAPAAIVLEFGLLRPADQLAVIDLLEDRGYRWCWQPLSLDLFAVRRPAP